MAERQLGLDLAAPPRRARAAALKAAHYRSHVPAEAAILGDIRAQKQEDRIADWMRTHPGRHTPREVHAEFPEMELTSVRRALTNLSSDRPGFPAQIVHHPEDRRPGPRGAGESVWEAKPR